MEAVVGCVAPAIGGVFGCPMANMANSIHTAVVVGQVRAQAVGRVTSRSSFIRLNRTHSGSQGATIGTQPPASGAVSTHS